MSLEGVLAREALIAVVAREGFDSEMDPLMPLEVVVARERLGALIALKRAILRGMVVVRVVEGMVGQADEH